MLKKIVSGPVTFKADGEPGEFRAVFATLNAIDKDGDVTLPGAFENGAAVRIAYWGHRWEDLPVGKGVIGSDEKEAWVDGKFFLDTEAGRETYQTVKNLGELQEWSYGYDPTDYSFGEFEGQKVRFLRKLDVPEVSPVLLGAGLNTRTTAIKSAGKASDFNQALRRDQTREMLWQERWDIDSALDESLHSILREETLDTTAKLAMLQTSCSQFTTALVDWASRAIVAGFGTEKGAGTASTKEGRRNAAKDAQRIQQIHDLTCELGAKCSEPSQTDEGSPEGEAGKAGKPSGKAGPSVFAARTALELLALGVEDE